MIRCLQVEYPEFAGGDAYEPDAAAAPGIVVERYKSTAGVHPSGHATDVLRRLTGQGAAVPSPFSRVMVMRGWDYLPLELGPDNKDILADYPAKPDWEVECHAYGVNSPVSYGKWLERLSIRALRDNVIIVAALPDKGMGAIGFLPMSPHVIVAGSKTGAHEQAGFLPYDVAGNHEWTSYSCPDVALAVGLIIAEYKAKNLPYNLGTIKHWLAQTAFINTWGLRQVSSQPHLPVRQMLSGIPAREPVAIPATPAQNLPPPAIPAFPGVEIAPKSLGSALMRATNPQLQLAEPGQIRPVKAYWDKASATATFK